MNRTWKFALGALGIAGALTLGLNTTGKAQGYYSRICSSKLAA